MNWEAVTAISTACTGAVILATAIVSLRQLRQFEVQRRDAASLELMRSLQDQTFSHAFRVIMSLPEGASAAELRARGAEFEEAAQLLALRIENLGVLAYRGTVAFEIISELAGGGIVGIWSRLKDTARETRERMRYPMYLEWFQWLAEQLEARERLNERPAHERLKDWRSS